MHSVRKCDNYIGMKTAYFSDMQFYALGKRKWSRLEFLQNSVAYIFEIIIIIFLPQLSSKTFIF
jgi:hypothetical protein